MKTAHHALLLLVPALLGAAVSAPPTQSATAAGAAAGVAPAAPTMAGMRGHCAPAIVTPVAGDPGAYRIQTPHGSTIARRPAPPSRLTATQVAEIRVFPSSFDADGDTLGTVHDTILVA